MDSLCTVFVDKLISRSMWASTHTSTCLLNKSHLKTHFSAPYCWHQFRGIPWATPQIEGRVLKRRQHLRCVVRCMSLYVALLPALPTPRTPLIVGSNRKVSHVDGEREGGGIIVRVRTSYSSNIKAMRYYAAQMLLFLVDMTPKLGLEHPQFVYFKSFVVNRPRIYRGQVYMLNGWEVCL